MKVAIVSIRFDRKGGSERRTYHLAKGLIEAGHEVEIFAAGISGMDLRAKINPVPMLPGPSFLKVLSFTRNVNRMLTGRRDIDVVHNQIRPFTGGVVTVGGGCHAEYLEKTKGSKGAFNLLDRVVLKMERERYKDGGCRAVITNSEFARKGILRHYPMPPEKVLVAYNGVDLSTFSPGRAGSERTEIRVRYGIHDEPVALFLGTGFERKGLATAIKALQVAKGMKQDISRLRLLVAGKDDPRPYMKLAGRLGVLDRVIFAGQTDNPQGFYGAADIFVLPTMYDPFSNAALEAMASGLPVITTAQNGVAEIIEDGTNGFVMGRADDFMGLAATLSYLSCEKARAEVGGNARKTAGRFTWENTLEKTLEAYGSAGSNTPLAERRPNS